LSKAKLILGLANAVSYSRIESELNTSRPKIARWKARFEGGRIAGLEGRHKGSRPSRTTPAALARVLKKTQQKPVDGSTHLSGRKMAKATGLSPTTTRHEISDVTLPQEPVRLFHVPISARRNSWGNRPCHVPKLLSAICK
jgi:transposase